MGQSLVNNYIHIIFSTKNRQPFIVPSIEEDLHHYLGGICKRLECAPLQIGGTKDHIHVICQLSKKISLVKLLEEMKGHSSKWVKTKGKAFQTFYWQDGYGAFSVSPTHVNDVIQYIANQKEHHKTRSFQQEVLAILNKLNIEFNEQYLWD